MSKYLYNICMNYIDNIPAFLARFDEIISGSQNILITSHKNPDDDSISSVLSLYAVITKRHPDKDVKIRYSSYVGQRWKYFENFSVIESVEDIAHDISSFDAVIFLDGSQYDRFSSFGDQLKTAPLKKICIDHHSSAIDAFDIAYVAAGRTSAAELLYTLFCRDAESIDKTLAETLMLGILGDTGSFRFINARQVDVFQIVSRLIKEGEIDIQYLMAQYQPYSQNVFRILQEYIARAKILSSEGSWPDFMTSSLSREFLRGNGYTIDESRQAAHIFIQSYGLSIVGSTWGFVVYPDDDISVTTSFRSLPKSINVRLLAENFGGGGHDRAAGMKQRPQQASEVVSVEDTFNKILQWIKDHKPLFDA